MAKKNHQHVFKHIAGGCMVGDAVKDESKPCDDHYRCSCGLEFRIYTTSDVHFALPNQITARK